MMVLSDGTNVGPGSRRRRPQPAPVEQAPPPSPVDGMPEGHEEQVAWVAAGETPDVKAARADQVYAAAADLEPEQREYLAAKLREAVSGAETVPAPTEPVGDPEVGADTGQPEPTSTETDDAGESSA